MEFVAIDLETTGLDIKKDKVIEVALVRFNSKTGEIQQHFTSFVNPLIPIPELNENITGISDKDVKDSPIFSEIREKISSFIWESIIVGHNVSFDINFLVENGVSIENNNYIDTFFLSNILLFKESSLNLESLCSFFWISFEWSHRAFNDTVASIQLFLALRKAFSELSSDKKDILFFIFSQSSDSNVLFLKKFLFDEEKKEIEREKFIKNLIDILDKKIPIPSQKNQEISQQSQEYKDIIEKIPWLGFRENQKKLMEIIFENIEKNQKTVIEAPTWIGKTLSYLVPAISYSIKTGEKVFISTKTKALQDQIFYKDIAQIQDSMPYDFSYVKIKWKKNYFSLFSFLKFFFDEQMVYEKVSFLSKIAFWLYETDYWEIDELNF
jgi:ATP-dependent DNA helicase DinG